MKTFAIFFVLLTFSVQQLDSCGVSTHISIANEALQSFADNGRFNVSYRNIILENLDAFYAGSVYPDAMYPSVCFKGRYHGIAEDTHWAPFLKASANYIRKTLPKPWNEATRKLLAFVLGVASHQVADITWHSLGIDQGFLQTMGKVNFHGSFSAAHSVGDVGGDMVSNFEGDLQDRFSNDSWYVPTEDLVNIYNELYGSVKIHADVILTCTMFLYAEWIGEKLAGADFFSTFAHVSPFLVEELHSYFLGGKSDMAAWTSIIWNETTHMIENGPNTCDIPRSTLYLRCSSGKMAMKKDRKTDSDLNSRPRISLVYFKTVNYSDINAKQTLRGVCLNIKGSTAMKLARAKKRLTQNGYSNETPKENGTSKRFSLSTKNKYARLGWSLITDQLPGFDQVLIAGAPWYGIPGNSQHGRVYILSTKKTYNHTSYIDIDETADQILDGHMENSRFGFALAVVDFNADGLNDLAISAPSEGSNNLTYTGSVYIYYGNSGGGVNREPDVTIQGDQRYYNLGTYLTGGDVNMDGYTDLIIGSKFSPMGGEQRGSVAVFLSRKMKDHTGAVYFFVHQADWILKGQQNYSWFGHEVVFNDKTSIGPVLIVSSPTYRNCALKNCSYSPKDIQSVGKLYAYRLFINGTFTLLFEVTGKASLAKFGSNIAIGDPFGTGENDILAVSSPSAVVKGHLVLDLPVTLDQAGKVYLFSLKTLAYKRNVKLHETEYVALFEGDRNYGKFGWYTSWRDVNGDGISDLVLGSPYRTQDLAEVDGGENGAVYIFYGGTSFPRGNATSNCNISELDPCPGEKASLYFTSNQIFSQFGRNVVSMRKFANSPSVIIAAPRYSVTSLHNGAIIVIPQTKEGKIWKKQENQNRDSSAIFS